MAALTWLATAGGAVRAGDTYQPDPLFHIERSKNANIVQYDAQVGLDGRLHPRRPVVVYWVRLAEQGQVKQLSWIQRRFAYGYRAELGDKRETAELKMVADFGRTIRVERDGDDYRAVLVIDGKPAWLHRIFVQSSGKGLSKKVDYVDLFGYDMADGSQRHERLKP